MDRLSDAPALSVDAASSLREVKQIYVTTPEVVRTVTGDYTAYRVVFNCQHEVLRRYSQFERLQRALLAEFPHLSLPDMPPRRFFGRFDPEFVETRRKGLQSLMNAILAEPFFRESPLLFGFLSSTQL